jgi:hypothetical protein
MPRLLFTRENAPEMARRSNAVQAQRRRERLTAAPFAPAPHPAMQEGDSYVALRLVRVRAQLDRIDRMIQEEKDPQKLDRLAAASMRLSDQEFALAGRPKPGNRRPPTRADPRPPARDLPAPSVATAGNGM